MTRLRFAPALGDDLSRAFEFLVSAGVADPQALFGHLLDALLMLEHHAEIGRPVAHGLRELVISRGKTGYLALYNDDLATDTVTVLRLRHQREAGHRRTQ